MWEEKLNLYDELITKCPRFWAKRQNHTLHFSKLLYVFIT